MKHILLFFGVFFMISSACTQSVEENKHEDTFTVYGNCGMCKKTIESSLKDFEGVYAANWDIKSKEMSVTYNPDVVDLDKIQQQIASVGYDSDKHRAKDEVYNALHACCQYERP